MSGAFRPSARGLGLFAWACWLNGVFVVAVDAQEADLAGARIAKDPPRLTLTRRAPRARSALRAETQSASATTSYDEATMELNVVFTDGKLWNPALRAYDKVKLRSYQGDRVDPDNPFISPMLEITPGDTVRITLNNQLPSDPSCLHAPSDINRPHCFNGTNLHTHGLWVNPGGNGDNVLIAVNPNTSFTYEYHVPSDHPAGTFWYHTHVHGSTALQVSSGMAGALLIRGDRLPTSTETGDIDTLLKPTAIQRFKERVVVLQQIQYACRDANGKIKANADRSYRCDSGDVGEISGYDQFGPGTWSTSGRYTSINGQVLPTFSAARTGQIERWRLIHAGVRDSINLEFRKYNKASQGRLPLRAADNDTFVAENCTGEPLPQQLIAADGLTAGAVLKTTQTVLQPGYRWDALLAFPEVGDYCVIDAAATPAASVGQAAPSRQMLGVVHVAPGRIVPTDLSAYLTSELVLAAVANMPAAVRGKVIADLRNGLKLSSFVPRATIDDSEVTGKQELVFNIDTSKTPPQFQIDGKPFDPAHTDRVLQLGAVDEWTLRSAFVSHPFHIHINPFQIVKILDPNGKDVSAPDAIDDAGGKVDPQFRGMKGLWKDTIWVKNLVPPGTPPGAYTVVVRTHYKRYIGDFVLHCHILDHEDQGMMQLVRIALPDGAGGIAHAHHQAASNDHAPARAATVVQATQSSARTPEHAH